MKSWSLSATLNRIAETLGFVDVSRPQLDGDVIVRERSPQEIVKALAAARRLRARAKEMKLGITNEEIRSWIKEGRR